MKYNSQTEAILEHMETHDGITSTEAFDLYGATRLSGLIYTLKKRGYHIKTEMLVSINKYGRSYRYAKYSLADI